MVLPGRITMFELISPLSIFGGIVIGAFILYYVGYTIGYKDAKKEFIAAVVKNLDTDNLEQLTQLIKEAAEKKNLLKSEQKSLVETILKEAERQRDDQT